MNRTLAAAALATTVVASTGVAVAATHGDRATPTPLTRVTHYYATGPSAQYDGDAGGIGTVVATRVRVPAGGGTYDAVVELSFQYRTKGPGPFVVSAGVEESDDATQDQPSLPGLTRLAAAPGPTSTTVRFVVPGLRSGVTYDVSPSVNSVFADVNVISTGRVVMTVDLTRR